MSKNRLQGLKKHSNFEQKRSFIKFIVFGQSIESFEVATKFSCLAAESSFLWITEEELSSRVVERQFPSSVRGAQNIALLEQEGCDMLATTSSFFYKDMKFRSFSGRSKPMPLLAGESFYAQDGRNPQEEKEVNLESFEKLLSYHKIAHIEKIVKVTSSDLLEKSEWEIHTANHEIISCEYLVWGGEPLHFHSLIEESSVFSELPNFLAESESISKLYVSFTTEGEVTKSLDTFFIPLSLSKPEGHFIGQFLPVGECGNQRIDFVHFFDEGKYNEDEIIKKIKNLKRSLQKIYDLDKRSSFLSEYYSLRKIDIVSSYNDIAVQSLFSTFPTLVWIGENAPLKLENFPLEKVSHTVRGSLSLKNFDNLGLF